MMETLQELLRPVRDQGDRETCLSMALSDGHRGVIRTAPALAVDFLHFHAATAAAVPINDAVPISAARDALEQTGQPAEVECPYSTTSRDASWKPTAPAGTVWRHTTVVAFDDHWASVIRSLQAGKPVVVVMKIDDAFWAPVSGVIAAPLDPTRASHAVLAVAHALQPERILVRNSWGEEWGDVGHAWISADYLAARCTAVISFEGVTT